MQVRNLVLTLTSLLGIHTSASATDVLVVGSGGPYFTINQALQAASDGDIILVKTGGQSAFTVDGKSVVITISSGGQLAFDGQMVVRNVGAGGLVAISGLKSNAQQAPAQPGAVLSGNAGGVRLQDCGSVGTKTVLGGSGQFAAGIVIENCASAVLFRCTMLGGTHSAPGTGDGTPGGYGLYSNESSVHLIGTSVTGGKGGPANDDDHGHSGGAGGNGVVIDSGVLTGISMIAVGGNGAGGKPGDGSLSCNNGGNGGAAGHGVVVGGFSTLRRKPGVTMTAGLPGSGAPSFCGGSAGQAGAAGQGLVVGPSALDVLLPGVARYLTASTVVREQQNMNLTFTGQPGDEVRVRVERFQPSGSPSKQLANPITIGIIPSTGNLVANVPIGELGAGVQGRILRLYPEFMDVNGEVFSSPDAVCVLLDSAY